jgi:hypothetical protein
MAQQSYTMSSPSNKFSTNVASHDDYMDNFINIMEPKRMPRMTKTYNAVVAYRQSVELTPEKLKETVLNSTRINNIVQQVLEKV